MIISRLYVAIITYNVPKTHFNRYYCLLRSGRFASILERHIVTGEGNLVKVKLGVSYFNDFDICSDHLTFSLINNYLVNITHAQFDSLFMFF